MRISHFDVIFDLCLDNPVTPVMYNCQTGRVRSTMAMVTTAIVRFYQHCTKDFDADLSILKGNGMSANFRTLVKLVALLPSGSLHERRVAVLSELAGKISSLTEHILTAFKTDVSKKALAHLAQYAHLIAFSCFCEQRLWSKTFKGTFSEWVSSNAEVRVLLNSITDQTPTPAGVTQERIPTPVGDDAALLACVRKRRGEVLCANMVLRAFSRDASSVVTPSVPGVTALRQIAPGVPLLTCGNIDEGSVDDLIYNIRGVFPEAPTIHLVDVRAEPVVYILGMPYTLLDFDSMDNEEMATLHISAERIEELENRLKQDVIHEAEANRGTVVVHHREKVAEKIGAKRVQTPRAVLESYSDIAYHRCPFPNSVKLLTDDFDPLIRLILEIPSKDVIVFFDSDGAMRTTICLNVAVLGRCALTDRIRSLRQASEIKRLLRTCDCPTSLSTSRFFGGIEEEELHSTATSSIQLHFASQLCQMLAAGTVMSTVNEVITLCGRGTRWNLLEAVDAFKTRAQEGDARQADTAQALSLVHKYMLVLLSAIYLEEVGPGLTVSFTQWCNNLAEVRNALDKIDAHPAESLKYVVQKNLTAELSADQVVLHRAGDVLTSNFGMKADHFPGCQKKGLSPSIPGAPNFRKVSNVNVYGVAIPTLKGLYNVLRVLGAADDPIELYAGDTLDPSLWQGFPGEGLFEKVPQMRESPLTGRVVWVNLREEPVIYVGDRPFVFRDLTNPYVNVELTGIESSKIEQVEARLREDILCEAQRYNNRFLVHDEGKPGELVGQWETATAQTVLTVREVFEEAARNRCRVKFARLPVTDEQSPEEKDFDCLARQLLPEIVACVYGSATPLSMVFNCQMGRGRTTTGMVICCLLIGCVCPEYYNELHEAYGDLWTERDSEYAKGNYACILQLRSVLGDGSEAKRRVDLVLEACGRMQNLRTSIETFKKAIESVDVAEEARGRALHHGIHYLQRYFNLIAYASYLREEYNTSTHQLQSTFESWMKSRDEIRHLHNSAALQ